jgi:hypothetical protein
VYDHDGHVTTNSKVYTSEYYAWKFLHLKVTTGWKAVTTTS